MEQRKVGSFRRKLIIMIMIQTVIAISILVTVNALNTVNILKSNLEISSQDMIEQIDRSLGYIIDDLKGVSVYFSERQDIHRLVKNKDNFDTMFKDFELLANQYPNAMNVYAATPAKDMFLYPTTQLPEGYDPTGRDWYMGAVASEGAFVTDPYVDAGSGSLVFTVSKAIRDNNEVIGVFAIDVAMTSLAAELNNIVVGKTGYPVLVDKDYNTLTHKNQDLVGKPLPVDVIVNEMKAKDASVIRYNYDNDDKLAVYKKSNAMNLFILVALPFSDIQSDINQVLLSSIIIGLISLIISIILAYTVARIITSRIKIIATGLERVKDGDLTAVVQIKSNDELELLAQSVNVTVSNLKNMLLDIQKVASDVTDSSQVLADTAEQTRVSAEEVTRTAEEISKGAVEQAEEAEISAHMTNTLAQGIDELTSSTTYMNQLAQETTTSNRVGVDAVKGLRSKTEENDKATREIEISISELDNKSKEIGNILVTISSIAAQTNLLALNASIEAARAGEHGRGFAVVADEIRKLAENSKSATEDIQEIVSNIQKDTSQTVAIMHEVKMRSTEQSDAVNHVHEAFEKTSSNIQAIIDQINNITGFMQKMNEQKNNIVMSITNISSISEETAAASEEVTASMEQQTTSTDEVANLANNLHELAADLQKAFARFTI